MYAANIQLEQSTNVVKLCQHMFVNSSSKLASVWMILLSAKDVAKLGELRYEYEYDDQIVHDEVEKSLFERKSKRKKTRLPRNRDRQKDPTLKYK